MKKIEYIIGYKKVTCDFYGIVWSINIDKWILNTIADPAQKLKVVRWLKEKSKQLLKIWQHRKEVGDGRWEFEDQSEITFLAKKIDVMEEDTTKMHKWQDEYDKR